MTLTSPKTVVFALRLPVLIFCLGLAICPGGCSPTTPPLSPEAVAFKEEVGSLVHQLVASLVEPMRKNDIAAITKVLKQFAKETPGICVDCSYRAGVLNSQGDLLITYPRTEIVGMNFSSYTRLLEAIQKQRITQRPVFLPNGQKTYFISAPIAKGGKVLGAVVLNITPADLAQKWQLSEEEFLAIDFNAP